MLRISSGKVALSSQGLGKSVRLCRIGTASWRRQLCFLSLLFSAVVCLGGPIYVSPSGNDAWTGELADPQAGTTTGPKKTLGEALRFAQLLHAAVPAPTAPITIILRGGTFELADTIALTAADSGTAASPLIIKAQDGEVPVLSGGTSFSPGGQSAAPWTVPVPAVFQAAPFSQLYIAGERRQRVKMPKQGYYQVAASVHPSDSTARDAFQFAPGDVSASSLINEVVVRAFQKWSVYTLQVAQCDVANHILSFNTPATGRPRIPFDGTFWYLLENVAEAPLAAGEWYFDRSALVLRYAPRAGEVATGSTLVAPRLETLLRLQGEKGTGVKIQNIAFQGITFAYTDWKLPAAGLRSMQGAVLTPGTVEVSSARDIAFTGCTFRATGAYGLVMGADVQRGSVTNSVFQNLGAGGIRIGSGDQSDQNVSAQWTMDCIIRNNIVAAYGEVHPDGIGIWVGYARGTDIENNEVTNGYYTGISVGWVWNYGLFASRDNIVRQNHIWHIGQHVLSDMGGIYTLGEQPGSEIIGNVVSDVQGARYGGWGVYCDQGSASISVRNNLAYNFSSSAMHLHWGRDLIIEKNIFALGLDAVFENTNPTNTGPYTFHNNVLLTDTEPFFGNFGLNSNVQVGGNLYVSLSVAGKLFPGNAGLISWQLREPDASAADPGFKNPQAGDFTPSQPQLLAAREIDTALFSTAGRLTGPAVPFAQGNWWDPAPPPQNISFSANFDANSADDMWPFATSIGSSTQNISVSSERFHSAPNSLKFTDDPLGAAWQPLASRMVSIANGDVHVSLWLWAEKGSIPWVALRDANESMTIFKNGPVVAVTPDGNFGADSVNAMPFPFNTWVKLDIDFGIGTTRTDTWSFTVTLESGEVRSFTGIALPASFLSFDWFGIAGYGTTTSNFFVDDINVSVVTPPFNARVFIEEF